MTSVVILIIPGRRGSAQCTHALLTPTLSAFQNDQFLLIPLFDLPALLLLPFV
jgi:hypothetical protein